MDRGCGDAVKPNHRPWLFRISKGWDVLVQGDMTPEIQGFRNVQSGPRDPVVSRLKSN